MLGALDFNHKEATVIGAGYAGLLAAYHLLNAGFSVTIFEAAGQVGGLIHTVKTEDGLVETAAHSFRSSPEILALCADLNVPLVAAQSKRKLILRNGRLRRFPLSLGELVQLLRHFFTSRARDDYASLAEWAKIHLSQAGLDYFITPMCAGIYATTPDRLDVNIAFPNLKAASGKTLFQHLIARDKSHRPQIMAPKGGMYRLIEALGQFVAQHPKANLHLNHAITALPDEKNIVVTTPADVSTLFFADKYPDIAKALGRVEYAPLIAATVFVDSQQARSVKGVGVLYAAYEKRDGLGILFNSATFTDRGPLASFTVMLGGTQHKDLMIKKDDELHTMIRHELAAVLGLGQGVKAIHINRWPRAIPLYSKALAEDLKVIDRQLRQTPGVGIFGNYTGEVSLRGMAKAAVVFRG